MSLQLGEPLMFVKHAENEAPKAQLAFVPVCAPAIISGDASTSFAQNVDWTWTPGSRTVELTAVSSIPFKTLAFMTENDGVHQLAGQYGEEGKVFHDLQPQATYLTNEPWPVAWQRPTTRLPKLIARLQAGQSVSIVVLGDSISAGYNASGFVGAKQNQKAWPALVAECLNRCYGSPITLTNLAVAGYSSTSDQPLETAAAASPHAVFIAYGMNDLQANRFGSDMASLIAAVQNAMPNAEILLITPMRGNLRIPWLTSGLFDSHQAALLALEADGIGVADVTAQWTAMESRKSFWSMSGNGINHPNDYGHRLYAKVVCAALRADI